MRELLELILTALIACGYDVISSLEIINTEYKPMIHSLPAGRHVIYIGRHEITFKKV